MVLGRGPPFLTVWPSLRLPVPRTAANLPGASDPREGHGALRDLISTVTRRHFRLIPFIGTEVPRPTHPQREGRSAPSERKEYRRNHGRVFNRRSLQWEEAKEGAKGTAFSVRRERDAPPPPASAAPVAVLFFNIYSRCSDLSTEIN